MELDAPGSVAARLGFEGCGGKDSAPTSTAALSESTAGQPAPGSAAADMPASPDEPYRSALISFAPTNSGIYLLNAFVAGSVFTLGQYASKAAVKAARRKLVAFLGELLIQWPDAPTKRMVSLRPKTHETSRKVTLPLSLANRLVPPLIDFCPFVSRLQDARTPLMPPIVSLPPSSPGLAAMTKRPERMRRRRL